MRVSSIIKGMALALMICVFLPFFSVSCSGATIEYSGWDTMIGSEKAGAYGMGEGLPSEANPAAFLLLAIPAAMLGFGFVRGRMGCTLSMIASLGGVVYLLLYRDEVARVVRNAGEYAILTVRMEWGYSASLVLYILAAMLSIAGIALSMRAQQARAAPRNISGNRLDNPPGRNYNNR